MTYSGLPKPNAAMSGGSRSSGSGRRPRDHEARLVFRDQKPEESLQIDSQTLQDLEVFGTETANQSLFDLCNRTRTSGGRHVLQQRFEAPWSCPDRISKTQQSVEFIARHLDSFEGLPSYTTRTVERYQREIIMVVTQSNPVEFIASGFALRLNEGRQYSHITVGVQNTCRLVREMRGFLEQVDSQSDSGELRDHLQEMEELMALPNFELVPEHYSGEMWFWKTLKLDQIFRVHEKSAILRLLELIYEVDSLVSMAIATKENGFIIPSISNESGAASADALYHPLISPSVPNPVSLDQSGRVLFLTGPNMAGKTTYLRALASSVFLAHVGMGVPAQAFSFSPLKHLFTFISMSDDLRSGVSYFRAESMRFKAIAEAVATGEPVLALLDEPFKGTNVKDAYDSTLKVLKRLVTKEGCLFVAASHLIELQSEFDSIDSIRFSHFEAMEDGEKLVFDYKLHEGISDQRLGLRVLEEEGVFRILDSAAG